MVVHLIKHCLEKLENTKGILQEKVKHLSDKDQDSIRLFACISLIDDHIEELLEEIFILEGA